MQPAPTSEERSAPRVNACTYVVNIYISDIPDTVSTQYGYADDLALLFALNDTLRIISGCLKPTRRELLPVLSGIPPAHLRREHSTFKLARQAQLNTNHPLYTLVHGAQFLDTQRLHSRRPFRRHAAALVNSGFDLLESWRAAWEIARPPAQF